MSLSLSLFLTNKHPCITSILFRFLAPTHPRLLNTLLCPTRDAEHESPATDVALPTNWLTNSVFGRSSISVGEGIPARAIRAPYRNAVAIDSRIH